LVENVVEEKIKIEEIPSYFHFNPNKSILYIEGNPVDIKDESNTYFILVAMQELGFDNKISLADIGDRIDVVRYGNNTDPIYDAIYQLKLRLEKLGYKEVFETTKKNVLVNKEYL
jgi:hypothetical protein